MAQGRKLVWASLLGVGLWQFALLGFASGPHGKSITLWASFLAPWLRGLATTAPIVVAGVITGCLLRPRRPEQLAALVAAAAALPIALPFAFGSLWHPLFMRVFGGSQGAATLGLPPHYWSREFVSATYRLFVMFWAVGLPAAVAGWVGARSWRAENWPRFWKGPGGAIIRGALVAGAVGVVLELVRWEVAALAVAQAQGLTRHALPLWHVARMALGLTASGAVVTALLVGWRPRWWWGAFAGSGIALALFSISLIGMVVESAGGIRAVHPMNIAAVSAVLVTMVKDAVAGAFAGNWEDDGET